MHRILAQDQAGRYKRTLALLSAYKVEYIHPTPRGPAGSGMPSTGSGAACATILGALTQPPTRMTFWP